MTMSDVNINPRRRLTKYSKNRIANTLLRGMGLYGIDSDKIRYEIIPLEQGIGLNAIVYKLNIYITSRSNEVPTLSLILKERIPNGGIDLFENVPWDRNPKMDTKFEYRFLKLFGSPRVIDYSYAHARIIMERWDGSLDELLLKQMNQQDPQKKLLDNGSAGQYLEDVVRILGKNSRLATSHKEILQQDNTRVPIAPRSIEVSTKKFRQFLTGIAKTCAKENSIEDRNGINRLIKTWEETYLNKTKDDLEILAKYISGEDSEKSVNSVIHFDARSRNVLYRIPDHNLSGYKPNVELTMCDFASVRLGPLAYDFITAVNDFHFVECGKVSLEQSILLFNDAMRTHAPLWTTTTDEQQIKDQLGREFVFSSVVDALTKTGVPALLKEENITIYNGSITDKVETVENKIRVKFDRLNQILAIFPRVYNFEKLMLTIEAGRNLGK